ncbi:unannotated protein [freshwater metagenome]|uniref:Unannotated protein n=1 Tax=freshwater metagenome TaxID=449393 RepID=A0A6J7JD66_9ZZZZ
MVVVGDTTAIAGAEEPTGDHCCSDFGLLPVTLHDHVASHEDLAIVGNADGAPDHRHPRPAEERRPLANVEFVPFRMGAVEGCNRRGLGEAVDLHELPSQLDLAPFNDARRRSRPRNDDPRHPSSGDRTIPVDSGIEDRLENRRRAAHQGDALAFDPPENFGAIDLALDHVTTAHARDRVQHPPAVAMELRERVQIHIAIVHSQMPTEDRCVQPHVAMGELHSLWSRRGARGVVDRRRGILVGLPLEGFDVEPHQLRVAFIADHPLHLARHGFEVIVEILIDHQDSSTTVLHDVVDLTCGEAKVDGNKNAART